MKVESLHLPPLVYVKCNSTGYPVKISAPDALVAKTMSKKMNFIFQKFHLKLNGGVTQIVTIQTTLLVYGTCFCTINFEFLLTMDPMRVCAKIKVPSAEVQDQFQYALWYQL